MAYWDTVISQQELNTNMINQIKGPKKEYDKFHVTAIILNFK